LLGTQLDASRKGSRWEAWRPSVSLCQQDDLLIHRFELLYPARQEGLARTIAEDIRYVSPETEVMPRLLDLPDPWNLESVYSALHDFARDYPFDTEGEEDLMHITPGTHVAQICMYLLTESRHFPGRLVQTSPGRGAEFVRG